MWVYLNCNKVNKCNWKLPYIFCSFLFIELFLSTVTGSARNIYVNNTTGSDSNSGLKKSRSFKTFQKAVSTAQASDFIYLANTGTPYKEMLYFLNKSGAQGKPITVEGNGAVISGCEPIDITQWQEVGPGLYKNSVLYGLRRFNIDVVNRYFFLFDGKINRMNRCLKGKNQPFKQPSQLGENEWTFTSDDNSFYLKIDPKKKLSDCKIEHPVRPTGVEIAGSSSYIIIKNVVCTNFYNDGFGITNTANHLRFENIKTLYCGDDGISAHASSQFDVDGFISIGNGTGICDTGNSMTSYNRVFIKDCVGVDLFFITEKAEGQANFHIRNSIILCNAARPVMLVTEKPGGKMTVTMENVLVVGKKGYDADIRATGHTSLYVNNSTFKDLPVIFNCDSVSIQNSIISGIQRSVTKYPQTIWKAGENIYQFDHMLFNNTKYSLATNNIDNYQRQFSDSLSIWNNDLSFKGNFDWESNNAGVDFKKLVGSKGKVRDFLKDVIKTLVN